MSLFLETNTRWYRKVCIWCLNFRTTLYMKYLLNYNESSKHLGIGVIKNRTFAKLKVKEALSVRAMAFRYVNIFCLLMFYLLCCHAMEPNCSSFEFEKKMLENTVRMEYEYKLSNEKVTKELISLLDEKEKFIKEITEAHERQMEDMKSIVASTTAELLELKTSTKSEISAKVKEMDATFENQQTTIQRLAKDLFVMKNDTIEELMGKFGDYSIQTYIKNKLITV